MDGFFDGMLEILTAINDVLWHNAVLYIVLGVGVLFTFWSGFCQYRALTHGVSVIRGKYDDKRDPGAINHFQALSAALSATVGLGNIAGVSVAVALGGPGAVFWMWVVGFVGMALKLTEVTLAMLYRNTDDPDDPHGGPMWVAKGGFARMGQQYKKLGGFVGGIFCVTLIISTVTGGNMFQAWSVAEITHTYFPSVPMEAVGIFMAVLVGLVIIGGIKRIGAVAGRLVPFMCVLYLLGALYVVLMNIDKVPETFGLIFRSAMPGSSTDPTGAFLGGTAGYALLWGMKRALFSSEAGQGSSPIAHSAAKTDEPVREGVVAGLEPFVDTLVVCTLTALVVLTSGTWNRESAANFETAPLVVEVPGTLKEDGSREWTLESAGVPAKTAEAERVTNVWRVNDPVFALVKGDLDKDTGREIHQVTGTIIQGPDKTLEIKWDDVRSTLKPEPVDGSLYVNLRGASLTGNAFDRTTPGLGMWIVTLACWLFAISTMISWSYYGEQGVIYLFGKKAVFPYKVIYCLLAVVATLGFIKTDAELDAWTALGTGIMLFANIPIMLIFGRQAMRAYHDYMRRLRSGEMDAEAHAYPKLSEVVEGRDV